MIKCPDKWVPKYFKIKKGTGWGSRCQESMSGMFFWINLMDVADSVLMLEAFSYLCLPQRISFVLHLSFLYFHISVAIPPH